jgi:hypothetical protein
MAKATYQQSKFHGGEWSPFYQGRADNPNYRAAMNVCRNGFPIEEGAWVRRPGTRLLAPSYKGGAAKVYPIFFTDTEPYVSEWTDGAVRFFNNSAPVITAEVRVGLSLSTDNPSVLTLQTPADWATGDEIAFLYGSATAGSAANALRQRIFRITAIAQTYPAWSSATTYGVNEIVTSGGTNYQSLLSGNLNHTPASSPTWWEVVTGTETFSLQDAVTGASLDGSTVSLGIAVTVVRLLRLTTPYTAGAWETLRIVQNKDVAIALNGPHIPQALTVTPNLGTAQAASASIADVRFQDGPYLDAVTDSQATVGGLSGVVEVTIDFASYDSTQTYALGDHVLFGTSAYKSLVGANLNNQPDTHPADWVAEDRGVAVTGEGSTLAGFQSTDVGRLMRFFSEPALWTGGSYSAGDKVAYDNQYYVAVSSNSAVQPDTDATVWTIDPTGARWTWGRITSVLNSNTVDVQIMGDPLLYNLTVRTWRLGVYSDTTGWPTCGIFNQGRIWFGGVLPNRFDASESDGVTVDGAISMAPTDRSGLVTDASGISYTLEGGEQDPIHWFALDRQGIVAGTAGGEWLISAPSAGPITDTNITAAQVSAYKCADIEPKRTGLSLVFVQKFKRRVMEFLSDVFTGRFSAPNLSETAKHLTHPGVEEIYYQQELTPILWARTGDGALIGSTYRRTSAFSEQAPLFNGWHRHDLGTSRTVESIAVGPSNDGSLDSLALVTNNSTAASADQVRWVEQLTTMFDEDDVLYDAWFLDGAIVPDSFYNDTVGGNAGLRFTGLWYLAGDTVTVFVGGLDVGDYTVDADGSLFVPFGTGVAPATIDYTAAGAGAYLFTQAFVDAVLALQFPSRNGSISTASGETLSSQTVNANPNGATSKIQSYVPVAGTLTGGRTDQLTVDWSNGHLFQSDTSHSGIRAYSLVTGTDTTDVTLDSLLGTTGETYQGFGACDPQGNLYFASGVSGYGRAVKVNSSLSLTYAVGTDNSSGPPADPSMVNPGGVTILAANANWIVSVQAGDISVNKGADGSFMFGNAATGVYQGLSTAGWTLTYNRNFVASGASTYGGNVASGYIVSANTVVNSSFDVFFVGVADGVPTGGGDIFDPGNPGKKGLGKIKGFEPAGFNTTPTVDNPVGYFAKIGTITAPEVDSRWVDFAANCCAGLVIDQSDNSVITVVQASTTGTSAYSSGTTYGIGDVVNSAGLIYQSIIAGNVGNTPASSPSAWTAVPMQYCIKLTTGIYSRNNTGSFAIKWIVPLFGTMSIGNVMSQGRINSGLFGIIQHNATNSSLLYLIDTTNGHYVVKDVAGVTADGTNRYSIWDSASQSVMFPGAYDSTVTGAPTGLNGTISASGVWFRLFAGTGLPNSGTVSGNTTTTPTGYTFIFITKASGGLPCVVGKSYTSQGQILRAIAPEESGARSGPAFGKTRRSEKYMALMHNTIGIQFCTTFTTKGLIAPRLTHDDTGAQYVPTEMFSGFWRDQLEDEYGFDSMVGWQILRPYPATIVSIGASIETSDA